LSTPQTNFSFLIIQGSAHEPRSFPQKSTRHGSTAGIGYIAPLGLARLGATVIVNGRTQARVDTAADKIRATVDGTQVIGVAAA
jgi:hypothetical protein